MIMNELKYFLALSVTSNFIRINSINLINSINSISQSFYYKYNL